MAPINSRRNAPDTATTNNERLDYGRYPRRQESAPRAKLTTDDEPRDYRQDYRQGRRMPPALDDAAFEDDFDEEFEEGFEEEFEDDLDEEFDDRLPDEARHKARYGANHRARPPLWKRARLWAMLLLLIGIAELAIAALTAQRFAVTAVDIAGLEMTPKAQVHSIAQELIGQNWILALTGQVVREVEMLPTVRRARVSRVLDWPPRLTLVVEERRPFARVGAGDEWWVVDEEGIPFRRATPDDDKLYAVTGSDLKPQQGRALSTAAWRPVVEFATALAANGEQTWQLRRIYFDEDGFASLRLTGGAHDELLVRLGADGWPQKLKRTRQALEYFNRSGQRASVLNLVSYNMPRWTPQSKAPPR